MGGGYADTARGVAVAVLRGVRTSSCDDECSNAYGHGKVAPVQGSRASRSVWVIAGASAVVQVVVGSLHRAPSWDEAIYLSQVARGGVALPFAASRARGITVLVAPLASVGAPLWLVRLALVLGSSLLAALVFRLWVPFLGWGAPVGMVLFMGSWPALFYGSEAMPNLWAALFAVGTLAFLARCANGSDVRAWDLASIGLMAAAMALMRPPDAVVLAVAASIVVLLMRGSVRAILTVIVGVSVGTLPWVVEMSVRYGGPVEAIEAARTVSHVGGAFSGVAEHLRLTDGPLLGPEPGGAFPWVGVLWWVVLIGLSAWAIRAGADRRRTFGVRIAAVVGVALAVEYLFLVSGLAPRFLLPALAVLSVSAGGGLEATRGQGHLGTRACVLVAVILAGWLLWQVGTFDRLEAQAIDERRIPEAVGLAIGEAVGEQGCLVASTDDFAQVAFAAGCVGRDLTDLGSTTIGHVIGEADRPLVVVVSRSAGVTEIHGTPIPLPDAGWSAVAVTP